ncbi:MAG: hypothetical protein KDB03_05120 [Planctomycetales bacterium]|nr:hypothetical protein [Planctomycetales bacterium]
MKAELSDFGIAKIAEMFPSLNKAEGIWPWNPERLDVWATEFERNEVEIHSARYVLRTWNPDTEWACGIFDQNAALKCWDQSHQLAFMEADRIANFVRPSS